MALSEMTPPAAAIPFLEQHGWADARIEPLAGDASFRRYFRVYADSRVAVLMDAPPPEEDVRPFMAMAGYLNGIGLSAPAILASDLDQGLLLIEDFGADRMREAVDADITRERAIYRGLVDVLVTLHGHAPPLGLERHGLDRWLDELDLFLDWYGPVAGVAFDRDSWRDSWCDVLSPINGDATGWVTELRDFHAENVMLIGGRSGPRQFGLLDFQDALVGHPAYDLVSLLQDARRDVSPAVEQSSLAAYMAATARDAGFADAYWALGAQRNTRILGVFCRLWKRDGKPGYTRFQPRMWGLLERDLAHPSLAPVRAWFDKHVPGHLRAPLWDSIHP